MIRLNPIIFKKKRKTTQQNDANDKDSRTMQQTVSTKDHATSAFTLLAERPSSFAWFAMSLDEHMRGAILADDTLALLFDAHFSLPVCMQQPRTTLQPLWISQPVVQRKAGVHVPPRTLSNFATDNVSESASTARELTVMSV